MVCFSYPSLMEGKHLGKILSVFNLRGDVFLRWLQLSFSSLVPGWRPSRLRGHSHIQWLIFLDKLFPLSYIYSAYPKACSYLFSTKDQKEGMTAFVEKKKFTHVGEQ